MIEDLQGLRADVVHHPLFAEVRSERDLQVFMSHHVFAVWDFMSLLKSLQNSLTCVSLPWFPPAHPEAARLINEIVLGEESDETEAGVFSHFELYRAAMEQAGVSTQAIDSFVARMRAGLGLEVAFGDLGVAPETVDFVRQTLATCRLGAHQVAASFFYGREDVIPDMFTQALKMNGLAESPRFALLRLYMRRHIEVDGDSHGPRARQLLRILCAEDPVKIREASASARNALVARKLLWDGVLRHLRHDPA